MLVAVIETKCSRCGTFESCRWEKYNNNIICNACACKIRYYKNRKRILRKNSDWKRNHRLEINDYQRKYSKKERDEAKLYRLMNDIKHRSIN